MLRDDLFVIDCFKEIAWPYGHQDETESLTQDSAGRLYRLVSNTASVPFACAHECLAGHLAGELGLPISPGQSIRFAHQEVMAQHWNGAWWPFDQETFGALPEAPALAASILAFDFWLGNTRRHLGSLVLDWPTNESARPNLLLTRHQRCFMGLYDEDDETDAFDPIPPDVEQIAGDHPLTRFVNTQFDFDPFVTKLERLDPERLRDLLRRVPGRWLTPGQKGVVFDYLSQRAQKLRSMLPQLKPFCPAWE